jgi:putative endonuclease
MALSLTRAGRGSCRRAINHYYLFTNVSMTAWLYILRLKSGQIYIGSTTDLDSRVKEHYSGHACRTTKLDPSIKLVYSESFPTFSEARKREAQIKRWTRAKKEALVSGDLAKLRKLSKSRKKSYVIYCRFTHYTLEKSEDFSSRLFSLLSTGL